jgi:hypothetical protein
MFNSPFCKHINRWGKNKGNYCNKSSRKKDSRCHKHRYRFLQYINNIYTSFKYLFNDKPVIIHNKKKIKKILLQKEKETFEKKVNDVKNNIQKDLKIGDDEPFIKYIPRIDKFIENILIENKYDKKILYKIVIDTLYTILNKRHPMNIPGWATKSNMILNIKKKYFLDCF